MRLRHKIAAVCAVVPVLAAVAAVGMLYDITFAGAGPLAAATAGCDVGQVPVNVPGLDPEQTRNVQVIIAEGRRLRVPVFGQEVAVATARQESTLRNLTGGNLDSAGLFQQRASWGTFMQRHTPAWAADAFYKRLVAVPHWQAMPLTDAAQAVQHSGTPTAYAAWTVLARQAVTGTAGTATLCQPTVGGGSYVDPFADRRWSPNRIDQGVDYGPSVPLPMLAIGDGVVLASSTTAGWPGGCWLTYRLTSGDHAGDVVFVAEHLTGLLPVGTAVRAGQRVATALPGDPWTESGFASKDGSSVATPYPVGAVDGYNTEGGKAFARFLIALGARYPGLSGENPGPGTTRPPN